MPGSATKRAAKPRPAGGPQPGRSLLRDACSKNPAGARGCTYTNGRTSVRFSQLQRVAICPACVTWDVRPPSRARPFSCATVPRRPLLCHPMVWHPGSRARARAHALSVIGVTLCTPATPSARQPIGRGRKSPPRPNRPPATSPQPLALVRLRLAEPVRR